MELRTITCLTASLALMGIALMAGGFFVETQFARTLLHVVGIVALGGSLCNSQRLIAKLQEANGDE